MWFAAILLVVTALGMIALVRGNASIRLLADVIVQLPDLPPRVSIVVAARDEAMTWLRDQGWTYQHIGNFFGRHHTSCMAAVIRYRTR